MEGRLHGIARALSERPHFVDLDGVLVDSVVSEEQAWRACAERLGRDPRPVIADRGAPLVPRLRRFAPDLRGARLDAEIAQILADELRADGVKAYPGAHEVLTWSRIVVVTGCARALACARLTAAGLPIPSLITAEDTEHGKPHPDPYRRAAVELGVLPAEATVVEDASNGVASALGAGVGYVVATLTTTAAMRGADLVVRDLAAYVQFAGG
jgi:sugar-phosphatase